MLQKPPNYQIILKKKSRIEWQMQDPVAELTRAFLTQLKIGVTAFIIVGRPQCLHVVTIQDLPRGDARVDTHKSTAECIDLEGLFYFLLCFYSILYRLSSTTTCQMSHNSGFIDKWYCCCYCYPWRIQCHIPHLFLINCTFYSIKIYWYNLL